MKNSSSALHNASPLSQSKLSLALLIVGNLIPLGGVLFYGWDLANVILLYWAENLLIGFWTVVKMLTAGQGTFGIKIFSCCFFTVHFGGFCMGHAAFILFILGADTGHSFFPFEAMRTHHLITTGVLIGTATILVTHGIEVVRGYLLNGEYKNWNPHAMMFTPYGHIFVVHITVMAGAALAETSGSPFWLLVLLVIGKTILDLLKGRFINKMRPSRHAHNAVN